MAKKTIGILALQGGFSKHCDILYQLGHPVVQVRKPSDLKACDALILPGGESTSLAMQIDYIGLRQPLYDFAENHPLFGTCAGLILMARAIEGGKVHSLNLLSVDVARNAYGSQADSFRADIDLKGQTVQAMFIRAPKITHCDPQKVSILATYHNDPVLVMERRKGATLLGATFHPELTGDTKVHELFLDLL